MTRQEINNLALDRVREGRFEVDADGRINSVNKDGAPTPIGHASNRQKNIAINFKLNNEVVRVQGGRLAWAIHYREWPPEHMSVLMVNGDKRDFRRDNLALVPRGKENALKKLLKQEV